MPLPRNPVMTETGSAVIARAPMISRPRLRVRRELLAQVPQQPRHAGVHAERLGPAHDAASRAARGATMRSAAPPAATIKPSASARDRAFDIPKAQRSGKNVSEHRIRSLWLDIW